MKSLSALLCVLLLIVVSSCSGGSGGNGGGSNNDPPKPLMGILQFRIRHNLHDDSCLASNDCDFSTEEEDDTALWLAEIAADSNLAVLHWDRAVPWLAFDEEPPPGTSRTEFFDARIDSRLRSWIDAFATHFASLPYGYLAVTPLHGERNKLERCRVDENHEVEITNACPDVGPGTVIQFQYDPGTGPVTASFDLETSYRNFVLYLYDKLQPDYLAIMIETNMFKEFCPTKWSGLVDLYRSIYDTVRTEVETLGAEADRLRALLTVIEELIARAVAGDVATQAHFRHVVDRMCVLIDLLALGQQARWEADHDRRTGAAEAAELYALLIIDDADALSAPRIAELSARLSSNL